MEQAFGKLKGRWRCLHKVLEDGLKSCVQVIEACFTLHNICQDLGDTLDPNDYEINNDVDDNNAAGLPLFSGGKKLGDFRREKKQFF